MTEFLLIRHGKTAGNLTGNYVGCRTDQPLCPQGVAELEALPRYPADRLYVSPMLRCRQTAAILFPGLDPVVVEDFRECDFGAFENRNFHDLEHDGSYRAWVEGNCAGPIPGGEHPDQFMARCRAAFAPLLERPAEGVTALVVHGGTIMAILSGFARPERPYFSYQAKNGRGYRCALTGNHLSILEEF